MDPHHSPTGKAALSTKSVETAPKNSSTNNNANNNNSNINNNHDILNFNDNYTTILQHLANDHPNLLREKGSSQQQQQQNLDTLLHHYQSLISKSDNAAAFEDNVNNSTDNNAHSNNSANNNNNNIASPSNLMGSCNQCKSKKLKCNYFPDLGNCLECETNRTKCTFNSTPNYLKRTSSNANNNFTASSHSKRMKNLEEYPNRLPSSMLYRQQQQQQQQQQRVQYPRSSFFVGPTSVFDLNLTKHVRLDNVDQIQLSKTLSLRKVSPTAQFILQDDFDSALHSKQEYEVDLVENLVHPHGYLLVEIFFKLIHPFLPILHERVFLEKYSRSYRELTAPLLASIYSLALQYWDFHPALLGFPKPDVVSQLNSIALDTFYTRVGRPKLSIIQTGLLILQCRSECHNNWVLCSSVVALAEELGLGVECNDWKLPKWEKDLRKRLAWAVWLMDKWCALNEGRQSHLILGRNWMIKLLNFDDFPINSPTILNSLQNDQLASSPSSSGDVRNHQIAFGNLPIFNMNPSLEDFKNGTLMFQQMVSLSIVLGEIMDTFYTQGSLTINKSIEQVLKLAKPLQLKLREWYHSLPKNLSMSYSTPQKFNSNSTLTLAYFATEITLHRKIICTLTPQTPKELVQVCRTAARTRLVAAIEFIRDLKNEHINSFWYNCSTGSLMLIGTFAALLYVTSTTKEEATIFRDYLRNYIWVLKIGSKYFEKLSNALNNMHLLFAQIPGLLTDEPMGLSPNSNINAVNLPRSGTQSQIPIQFNVGSPAITEQGSPLNQWKNLPQEILQQLNSFPNGTTTTTTPMNPTPRQTQLESQGSPTVNSANNNSNDTPLPLMLNKPYKRTAHSSPNVTPSHMNKHPASNTSSPRVNSIANVNSSTQMNAPPLSSIHEPRQDSTSVVANETSIGTERSPNEHSLAELKGDNSNLKEEPSAADNQTIEMNEVNDKNVTINTKETHL
ncbi:Fungal specific transcription factor [Saccharomyces pastorianus]|uniref:Fungal specific transcription factor n=1 Tax=Saccharomyces pastorianus TaxID=27292 RepID=A0A6C1EA34_SACPS|nr:Fungal specific transcription factor [Saccharomyces pastorianus]